MMLSSETRMCLLNSIVNELRYINSHTYFYSWMVLYLYNDILDEGVQEQITRILIERLQTHDPHPWGLCITFRELLQNPKYCFAKKSFVVRNQAIIEQLMQTKLSSFYSFWSNNKSVVLQQQQQSQHIQGAYSSNISTPTSSQMSQSDTSSSLRFNTDL
jgi:CCR4-Not complex component, Not1